VDRRERDAIYPDLLIIIQPPREHRSRTKRQRAGASFLRLRYPAAGYTFRLCGDDAFSRSSATPVRAPARVAKTMPPQGHALN
jgi:hypothetical protein